MVLEARSPRGEIVFAGKLGMRDSGTWSAAALMANFCPQCGLRVVPADRFCGACGAGLRGTDSPSPLAGPDASRALPELGARRPAPVEHPTSSGRGIALTIYLGLLGVAWGLVGLGVSYLFFTAPVGSTVAPSLSIALAVGMLAVIAAAWNYKRWAAYTIVLAYSGGAFVFLAQGSMIEFTVATVIAGVGLALFSRNWACFSEPP